MIRPTCALAAIAVWLLAAPHTRADLIVNGDFESGNTGFATAYTFAAGAGIGGQQSYDIITNPADHHPSGANYGDHTTGAGLMMAVNGSHATGKTLWSQTIAVVPDSDYDFSLWSSTWAFLRPPSKLDVLFNGQSLGTFMTPSASGVWQEFGAMWNSGSSTLLVLSLVTRDDVSLETGFSLDDISLTGPAPAAAVVPEPTSLLLALVGGAGLLGWRLRRGGAGRMKAPGAVAVLAVGLVAAPSARADLIVNGNFESGNTGFTTEYTRVVGAIGGQFTYDILSNPFPAHPSAASYGDHTTGTGLMMAVNEATSPNRLVWGQTVPVVPGSDYHFSTFISSWVAAAPSRLDVLFNGVSVGTMQAPGVTAQWVEFTLDWNSGAATSLTIALRNITTADIGGDFALDDISLTGPAPAATVVPEPSSLLLALAGGASFAGWCGVRRKRTVS